MKKYLKPESTIFHFENEMATVGVNSSIPDDGSTIFSPRRNRLYWDDEMEDD